MTFPMDRISNLLERRDLLPYEVKYIAEVGSTAHGISTPDTGDDLDLTLVRMEGWHEMVNGPEKRQSMMIRTQPDGVRSRMGDLDLNVYTLRKFAYLASKGNPSILGAIFSPNTKGTISLEPIAGFVASRRAGASFLGYMRQQMERWQGTRGQRGVTRPELIEAYGFDTKYAAHILRLGFQGAEYMSTGRFSMPLPPDIAGFIKDTRLGGFSEAVTLKEAERIEQELIQAVKDSPLPHEPNTAGLAGWLTEQYGNYYLI